MYTQHNASTKPGLTDFSSALLHDVASEEEAALSRAAYSEDGRGNRNVSSVITHIHRQRLFSALV